MEEESFKMYDDEASRQIKSDLKQMLNNIGSLVNKFMKVYDSNHKLQNELPEKPKNATCSLVSIR